MKGKGSGGEGGKGRKGQRKKRKISMLVTFIFWLFTASPHGSKMIASVPVNIISRKTHRTYGALCPENGTQNPAHTNKTLPLSYTSSLFLKFFL